LKVKEHFVREHYSKKMIMEKDARKA